MSTQINDEKVRVQTFLNQKQAKKFNEFAEENGLSSSAAARQMILKGLKAK